MDKPTESLAAKSATTVCIAPTTVNLPCGVTVPTLKPVPSHLPKVAPLRLKSM